MSKEVAKETNKVAGATESPPKRKLIKKSSSLDKRSKMKVKPKPFKKKEKKLYKPSPEILPYLEVIGNYPNIKNQKHIIQSLLHEYTHSLQDKDKSKENISI